MKKYLLFVLIMICYIPWGEATSPGTSNIAARITDFGEEFGFGRMLSSTQMFLIHINGRFNHSSSVIETSTIERDGPDTTRYAIHLYPELRFYNRPKSKISPFFGVFAHFGYGGTTMGGINDNLDADVSKSQLTLGGGFSTGAEVFLSSYLSFAVSARWLHYSYNRISESNDSGAAENITTYQNHNINLKLNPAVYLRLHF